MIIVVKLGESEKISDSLLREIKKVTHHVTRTSSNSIEVNIDDNCFSESKISFNRVTQIIRDLETNAQIIY